MDSPTARPLKLYSLEEVSNILRISHRTVWNYVKAGKLDAIKVGREWRVPEETLLKFIYGDKPNS